MNLVDGLLVAITFPNVGFCLCGVLLGTLIGVLPGIGPVSAVAMLLPFTFGLPPIPALIMLAGIYYGAQYGGSTTAILVNMPGESSSVVTCLDGYQMARKGRAGAALSIAAIGSFIAGCVSVVVIGIFSLPLSLVAERFQSVEYFSLMAFGLVAAVTLARGSVLKASEMVVAGLLLGLVGTDLTTGQQRFTLGIPQLADGIGFLPIAIGVFGLGEVAANLGRQDRRAILAEPITRLWPTREEFSAALPAIFRGTAIGSVLGVLPGGGALLSSFAAYTIEKKIADDPSRFGQGAIEGVAAPEAANNAGAQTSFIPLLTLGIPPTPTLALMMGAMLLHGIQPGPAVIMHQPDLFWSLIASMWVGNAMLLIINLPLVGIWVYVLAVPYRILFPAILLFCCIGVYSINNSTFEVGLTALFGLIGYFFIKAGFEPAPLLLGFILGPLLEENLRRAVLISVGDPSVFVSSRISAGLLATSVVLLGLVITRKVRDTQYKAL
jgi:TctA family transporter